MLFATAKQGALFLWMMAGGAAIGFWYMLTAGLRRFIQAGFWLSLICDLAFGLGAATIFCLALVSANRGALRLYTVASAALGFALFALGAFPAGRRALSAAKRGVCHIIVKLSRYRWIKVIFR